MKIAQFNQLTEEETQQLLIAPAYISYLIGGADNDFDEKEQEQAKYVVHLRNNVGDPLLFDYYTLVAQNFEVQLNELIAKYENLQAETRTDLFVEELSKLNEILQKIDNLYARTLLKSWRGLAKEVAEASGGLLGVLNISYEEEHLMDLQMIKINE